MSSNDVPVPNTGGVMAKHAIMNANMSIGGFFTLQVYLIKSNATITYINTNIDLNAGLVLLFMKVDNIPPCAAARATNMGVRNRG